MMRCFLVLVIGLMGSVGSSQESSDPLQDGVKAAIQKGIAYLKKVQREDGSFRSVHKNYVEPMAGGYTALGLMALLKAGVQLNDPSVQKAAAFLRGAKVMEKQSASHIYVWGLLAMALGEVGLAEDKNRIRQAAALINTARTIQGGWAYLDKTEADVSQAHFAVAGLDAAERAGEKFPAKVWEEIIGFYLTLQKKDGGWGCCGPDRSNLAMTGSGVWALTLCQMKLPAEHPLKKDEKIRQSIQRGLDWMGKNFWVDTGPREDLINRTNKGSCEDSMLRLVPYYYLASLVQAGCIAKLEKFGDHDWYHEGAEFLVRVQKEDGSWAKDPELQTAYALLFLTSKKR